MHHITVFSCSTVTTKTVLLSPHPSNGAVIRELGSGAKLSGIIEKDRWVCEWNFPVSYRRIVGFVSGTFRRHRKDWLGVRVELSGIIEKDRWVLKWKFPVSYRRLAGFAGETFWLS